MRRVAIALVSVAVNLMPQTAKVLPLEALPLEASTSPAVPLEAPTPAVPTPIVLSPATSIELSNGIGRTSGTVSTAQQFYRFNTTAGNRVTVDINVTQVLTGQLFSDNDSQLFLFDSEGRLVAENDDDTHSYQSRIRNFIVPDDGTYFVAVTTFNNDPILDAASIVTGWEADGDSSIEYDLTVVSVLPR